MSIGETLAKARRDAGLTVSQVSERTRIRETIIRGMERDDYSACGGDFYARGDIRSVARALGLDPAPLIGEYDETLRAPEEITAAEALRPAMPIQAVPRRRANWTMILGLALLAVVAFVGYLLVSGSGHAPAAATGPRGTGHAAAHTKPTRRHTTPSPTPSAPAVTALTPVSVAAFGPGGAAEGDSPQIAQLAVAGNLATPWHTSWYATPHFGNLKSGTGLLLDLGKPVTVTSAQVTLGSTPGADLELRVGNVPALASLQPVATATNVGGTVQLRPAAPVSGRYLLVWFTLLPPDNAGTYQAYVSDIKVIGRA